MKVICPFCKIIMKKEKISRSFGNPHTIVTKIETYVCPGCNFSVISEDEYEKIRKKTKQECIKNLKAELILL